VVLAAPPGHHRPGCRSAR